MPSVIRCLSTKIKKVKKQLQASSCFFVLDQVEGGDILKVAPLKNHQALYSQTILLGSPISL